MPRQTLFAIIAIALTGLALYALNVEDLLFSDQLLVRFDDGPAGATARFDFILDIA